MSDGKWYDFFTRSDESTKRFRKLITTILLIVIIVGYSILIITNILIVFSIKDVKIEPDEFDIMIPTNETIVLKGKFIVENDHWNSFDIRDLKMGFDFYTDNHTYLIGDIYKRDMIPRLKTSELITNFEFNFSESPDLFIALNETESLEMDLTIEFRYVFYRIYFEIEFIIEEPFE